MMAIRITIACKFASFALGALALTLLALTPAAATDVPGTSCPTFPDNNFWHADVSALPRHKSSKTWMQHMGATANLHPDFGDSFGELPVPYGIPITVVSGGHAKVAVKFSIAGESDKVKYPLGADTKVEGGQFKSGDRHTIVVDKSTCRLYETWATRKVGNIWLAGSGATWDLNSNALRPKGFTSADAAGLPILPGLLTYEEVKARKIDHAIRFTVETTAKSYIWPARHQAGDGNASYPPMGARFRLKADYPTAGLRADTKAVIAAMKTYGLVLADNGSDWYFQGTADERWPNPLLDELKQIPAKEFEAVDTSELMVNPNTAEAD
jgi:hypothetical protein